MKKYNYIYKITKIASGKIYIGTRGSDCLPEDDLGYWGSSKILKPYFKQHGHEGFKKEILSVWDTETDAYEEEARIVNKEFVLRTDTYNITRGGANGVLDVNNRKNIETGKYTRNKEHKKAVADSNKARTGSKWIRKTDLSLHKLVSAEDAKELLNRGNWELGRLPGNNANRKGTVCLVNRNTNEETSTKDIKKIETLLSNGWVKGKKFKSGWYHNKKTKSQLYIESFEEATCKLKEGWSKGPGSFTKKLKNINTNEVKLVIFIEEQNKMINNGWVAIKHGQGAAGKKWMTSINGTSELINIDDIESKLKLGYVLGRVNNGK
jgi:hypothetical protein